MNKLLVLQSDFGLVDGAVAAMTGVALSVEESLKIYNLTHDIPPFDTFEASYRLIQAVPYWPSGTVFVSVVDPGVGSSRKSVVAKTKTGQYIVTPDNGSLTHIAKLIGVEEIREIDEAVGRRKGSEYSNTFHGRDIYSYTGALLASGKVAFENIGPLLAVERIVTFGEPDARIEDGKLIGGIETHDVRFGSAWSDISRKLLNEYGVVPGETVDVSIYNATRRVYHALVTYVNTFSEVEQGETLLYINSMDHLGIAINQGNFAQAYHIGTRSPWKVVIEKLK